MSAISARIRERRLALGLTQAACAERAAMAQPNWARLEREDSVADSGTWSVEMAGRVSAALEMSRDELLAAEKKSTKRERKATRSP